MTNFDNKKLRRKPISPEQKSKQNKRDYRRRKKESKKLINVTIVNLKSLLKYFPATNRWMEIAVLLIMIGMMTKFVIHETTGFFEERGLFGSSAKILGAIWEVSSIVLTYYSAQARSLNIGRKALVVALCLFNICVVSKKQYSHGTNQRVLALTIQTTISETVRELKNKESLRNDYFKQGWLSAARQFDKSIDELRKRLDKERERLKEVGDPSDIISSTWIEVVSRVDCTPKTGGFFNIV